MPSKLSSQYKVPPLPIFRKLFRKGNRFICGICRSEYSSRLDGNNCLNFCWFELKRLNPVLVYHKLHQGLSFRCQYCARDYNSEEEAKSCASQCEDKRNHLHIHEQLFNDLPLADHRPQPIFLIRSLKDLPRPAKKQQVPTRSKPPKFVAKPSKKIRQPMEQLEPEIFIEEAISSSSMKPGRGADSLENELDDIDIIVHIGREERSERTPELEDNSQLDLNSMPWSVSPIGFRCNCCQAVYDSEEEARQCYYSHQLDSTNQSALTSDIPIDLDS